MSGAGRALVVDDDPHIAEVLSTLLELRGFEVDVVADGIEALEPSREYDVVLLDLKMPVFDGERLADYWLATRPELLPKVIVLSGYSSFTSERILPVFKMIQKPFELESIARAIEECVLKSDARLEIKRTPETDEVV